MSNTVHLVQIDLVVPTICGAPVGSSGRFCLLDRSMCLVKSYKKAGALGWSQAQSQGAKHVFFIQAPGVPTSPTAFQSPWLDMQHVSADKLEELLSAHKPAVLWAGLFSLLKAGAAANDDAKLNSATSAGAPLGNDPDQGQEARSEAKLCTATTPAKRHPDCVKDEVMSPRALILKQITEQMEEGELKATLQNNLEQLCQHGDLLAGELQATQHRLSQQEAIMSDRILTVCPGKDPILV
ncbi:hypothetical protein ACA910_002211 [Epithemia clementina (nom. ined.)]